MNRRVMYAQFIDEIRCPQCNEIFAGRGTVSRIVDENQNPIFEKSDNQAPHEIHEQCPCGKDITVAIPHISVFSSSDANLVSVRDVRILR